MSVSIAAPLELSSPVPGPLRRKGRL